MTKRLYRSGTDRWVAGVCGGLGEYFGIDPTLIRLLWIVLLLPGGIPGLVPYIICWAVIPREPAMLAQLPAASQSAAVPSATAGATLPDVVPPAPPADTNGQAQDR